MAHHFSRYLLHAPCLHIKFKGVYGRPRAAAAHIIGPCRRRVRAPTASTRTSGIAWPSRPPHVLWCVRGDHDLARVTLVVETTIVQLAWPLFYSWDWSKPAGNCQTCNIIPLRSLNWLKERCSVTYQKIENNHARRQSRSKLHSRHRFPKLFRVKQWLPSF